MSHTALRQAFRTIRETPELKPCSSITLLVLANCHNQETGRCDPSIATIAKLGSISPRAVQDGLKQLSEMKKIAIVYRQSKTGRGKRNMTSRYRILGGAKFASTLVQNLHPNLEDRQTSAFDDLAMMLESDQHG